MEYKVVNKSSIAEVEKAVKDLIKKGWKPQGGISYHYESTSMNPSYVQAMIKQE